MLFLFLFYFWKNEILTKQITICSQEFWFVPKLFK